MFTKLEDLPNEILLRIVCYLSWVDVLTPFCSLNIRYNSLICSTLSLNDTRLNNAFFTTHGLPYYKCRSVLYSVIFNCQYLCLSIKKIHFDGSNSTSYDLCYRWLFNDQNNLRFPNLKSLAFTRCGSIRSIIRSLLYLIEHQLEEIKLEFDSYVFHQFDDLKSHFSRISDSKNENLVKANEGKSNYLLHCIVQTMVIFVD